MQIKHDRAADQGPGKQGVTLLEVMLVLAIVALIVVLGIRQYIFWQNEVNIQRVRYNINDIFQALHYYYQANCYGSYNPEASSQQSGYGINYGQLNPANPRMTLTVSISDLSKAGFLQGPFPFVYNDSAIIDTQKGEQGYFALFLKISAPDRTLSTTNGQQQSTVSVGQINVLVSQVAVKLVTKNASLQQAYLHLLQGNCLQSDYKTPCKPGVQGSGAYVIWEQPPSLPTANSTSDYWPSNPQTTQFMQLYTTYPVNYLTGSSETPNQYQYFLCNN